MSASKRLGAVATHLAAATQQEIEETAAWTLGIYGNRPVSTLKAYDYSPSDYAGFPDVTVRPLDRGAGLICMCTFTHLHN
jgi:hypothetical protein